MKHPWLPYKIQNDKLYHAFHNVMKNIRLFRCVSFLAWYLCSSMKFSWCSLYIRYNFLWPGALGGETIPLFMEPIIIAFWNATEVTIFGQLPVAVDPSQIRTMESETVYLIDWLLHTPTLLMQFFWLPREQCDFATILSSAFRDLTWISI